MEHFYKALSSIYNKFRIHFYMQVFANFETREATLTTVETFSMECIMALGNPTIAEFARMMNISAPNAAYRVNSLLQKGYIEKIQSKEDQREYHIRPTRKYLNYANINQSYLKTVDDRCRERFSQEDYQKLREMLEIINDELMPELDLDKFRKQPKPTKDKK